MKKRQRKKLMKRLVDAGLKAMKRMLDNGREKQEQMDRWIDGAIEEKLSPREKAERAYEVIQQTVSLNDRIGELGLKKLPK